MRPLLTGTFRKMERMANQWGGGLYSDDPAVAGPNSNNVFRFLYSANNNRGGLNNYHDTWSP
jgi:hypothetical protein